MATLKGQTIAASYQDLVKRADTYAQTGTNVEIMDDSAVVQPTGLYLESGATTDNVGIGVSDPDELLELYKVGTQLKLSGGAADYATFAVAADGALTITTVDVDAAEADIILAPDGNVGIGDTTPESLLHMKGANPVLTIQDTETSAGSADARIRLAESDGPGDVQTYWDIHNSGHNLLLTRSDGTGNVVIRSCFIDDYAVNIKPADSTNHMTMGLADKQNNYSLIGIYSAAAAAISGVSADSSFDNW